MAWVHGGIKIIQHRYGRPNLISQLNTRRESCVPEIVLPWNLSIRQPEISSPGTPTLRQKNTPRSGSITISSIIKPLENAFLCLEDLAFRTAPCVRYLLPRKPRGNVVLWVTLGRVVNIVAFKTDPSFIFRVSWHCSFQLLFLVKRISSVFPAGIRIHFLGQNLSGFMRAPAPGRTAGHRAGLPAAVREFFPQE